MYGRIHSDMYNVTKFLHPGIKLHIKFTKAKPSFYLMNPAADSKPTFKFLDAKLLDTSGQTRRSRYPTKRP